MRTKLKTLEIRISASTGSDRELDQLVATTLVGKSGRAADYSSSVDACLALIAAILPEWHWHVGHGSNGVLPYAALYKGTPSDSDVQMRVESGAPTVPLALLHAIVKALIADQDRQPSP